MDHIPSNPFDLDINLFDKVARVVIPRSILPLLGFHNNGNTVLKSSSVNRRNQGFSLE